MKKAADKIMAGLNDALAYAQGDTSRARIVKPVDVKAVRSKVKMTQAVFADTFKLPISSVRDWEQGRFQPDGGSRAYLSIIQADPIAVQAILSKVEE